MKRTLLLPLCTLLLCTGCAMIPKYRRPAVPVPGTFQGAQADGGAPQASEVPWRSFFTDPGLQGVIQLALDNNRDLRVAALNVEKLQAAYRIQRADLFPTAGVMATGNKYRSPERMNNDGRAKIIEQDSVQFGVMSWELDFFGRIRSLKEKALNQYLATEQAKRSTQISLVAAVAQAYLTYASDRENLDLAQATYESQKTYFELISKSRELGVASDLDQNQAQSQMDSARTDMARYKSLVAIDRNALDLLAGTPVPTGSLPKGLDGIQEFKPLSAGLPSEVLLRRPDILMAEFQLKGANANIGAARAAFFPSISLTAGIGTMSPEFSSLFGSGTRTWSFSPKIVSPLFAGGSLWANLKVSKLDRDIAVAQYEKAIQTAFREVNDGLVQREALAEQLDSTRSQVEALATTHKLSSARYKEGLDGYLSVLVAQRLLYSSQQGLVATRLATRANQVTLYKTLGGGS